ncbi:MAG: glycosyltransferase family 4 protein, partial [Pseudomonadota bacterium]|nr:glycosyltransferase family 4 protein [Pseudomonadota bacterium]
LAPLHRARHLARAVPEDALREADLVVALDCHFADALRRMRPRRLLYLSLSCTPRQEWFAASSGAQVGLTFLQYAWLERRVVSAADRVIVASETHAAEMRRFDLMPAFRPLVLHPAFPPSVIPVPRRVPDGRPVTILGAGRLEPGKNFAAALELAARLKDCSCRFVIAGDGPELGRLQAKAAALGVGDRVTFAGSVVPSLDALLAETDLFLHTSLYESFGIAPFEAMRAGVPPVCGKGRRVVAGCAEIMQDGVDSLFIDLDQPAAGGEALRRLVVDRKWRERMGEAARASAERVLANDYTAAFRRVVGDLLAPAVAARP